MNQELLLWVRQEDNPAQDDEEWTLHEPDLSLAIWKAMEATQWRHLPSTLLNEPDWLIHDLYILAWRKSVLKELAKSPLPGIQTKPTFGG